MAFGSDLKIRSEPISYQALPATLSDLDTAIALIAPRLLDRKDLFLELAEKFTLLHHYVHQEAPYRDEALYVAALATILAANAPDPTPEI